MVESQLDQPTDLDPGLAGGLLGRPGDHRRLYGPEQDPGTYPEDDGTEVNRLQPAPDAMVIHDSADLAAIVGAREGLRLALIASMQYLPPRQRAVLVLRDVLAFPAAEVAVMLGITTASVKSALQRARARLRELAPAADQIIEPTESQARALIDQYITAFENADATALERLLFEDATLEATPLRTWFADRTVTTQGIRQIRSFGDPNLVALFGLPLDPSECTEDSLIPWCSP